LLGICHQNLLSETTTTKKPNRGIKKGKINSSTLHIIISNGISNQMEKRVQRAH
jgi:hypothetical protein